MCTIFKHLGDTKSIATQISIKKPIILYYIAKVWVPNNNGQKFRSLSNHINWGSLMSKGNKRRTFKNHKLGQ